MNLYKNIPFLWVQNKIGLSWQITLTQLIELLSYKNSEKVGSVYKAFLAMKKIIIAVLEKATKGNQ